jgi:hypothetical protein
MLTYAFAVRKRGEITVFTGEFAGGYILGLVDLAKSTAREMRGRLVKSSGGFYVETLDAAVSTPRAFAERFGTTVFHVERFEVARAEGKTLAEAVALTLSHDDDDHATICRSCGESIMSTHHRNDCPFGGDDDC